MEPSNREQARTESLTRRFQMNAVQIATTEKQLPRLAYKLKESAQIIGVSEKSIRRAIDRGLLKPSRAFRHVLISATELEAFLKNTTEGKIS